MLRIAQNTRHHGAQPRMVFLEYECRASAGESSFVTVENSVASVLGSNAQVFASYGQMCAGGQPDQVDGIRKFIRLIKIVNAPNEPAFHIPPGAEVLHV